MVVELVLTNRDTALMSDTAYGRYPLSLFVRILRIVGLRPRGPLLRRYSRVGPIPTSVTNDGSTSVLGFCPQAGPRGFFIEVLNPTTKDNLLIPLISPLATSGLVHGPLEYPKKLLIA